MRNPGIRITLDAATQHAVEDLARRQSRPVANAALFLIKLGLSAIRAEQRDREANNVRPN